MNYNPDNETAHEGQCEQLEHDRDPLYDYSEKVDYMLDRLPPGFTEQDFVNLAIASLDQAGLSIKAQQCVIKIIEESLR